MEKKSSNFVNQCYQPFFDVILNLVLVLLKEITNGVKFPFFKIRLIDNLPAATKFSNGNDDDIQYENGFRLGFIQNDKTYINNHLKITLFYHKHAK